MYAQPKFCPQCGKRGTLEEQYNVLTTGIPLNRTGSIRFRLLFFRGFFRPRFRVEYRCRDCGFRGKYQDRDRTWKSI